MKIFQQKLANIFLILALAGTAHAIWAVFTHAEVSLNPWTLLIFGGFVAASGLILSIVVKFKTKLEVSILALSLVASSYAGIFFLELSDRSLFNIFETKVVRNVVAQPALVGGVESYLSLRPTDERTQKQVYDGLRQHGYNPNFMFASPQLLPVIANGALPKFLPLSSLANAVTIFCNEGDQREFPIIRTDRYGFNNDDTVYAWSKEKILIVGDSFAQGSCVHQEQSVAGVLRRNGYPAISVGIGGFGPVMTLASLKEYGEPLKPKTVLWFYFDGNDVSDLEEKGLRSKFLLRYLREGFSQNLIKRQEEVDRFWRGGTFGGILNDFQKDDRAKEDWDHTLIENLPLVRELTGMEDLDSLTDDESLVRIFTKIMAIAKRRVEAWGGKLYFVVIPNKDDYHGRVPKFRFPIMTAVRKLEIPIVDVDAAIRSTGDPLRYYPVRDQWGHFNAEGYRVFSRQVISALESGGADTSGPVVAAMPKVPSTKKTPASAKKAVPNPKKVAVPAKPVIKPTGNVRLEYKSYGRTSAIIPTEAARARKTHGASILGYQFIPGGRKGTVELNVSINAYAEEENELIVTVFKSGQAQPLHLARQMLVPAKRGFLETKFKISYSSHAAMNFDVRVGPARAGTIFINGNSMAKQDLSEIPYLSITETVTVGGGSPMETNDISEKNLATKADSLPKAQRWGRFWRQQYSRQQKTSAVMPTQLSARKPGQGEEVLGFTFSPTNVAGKFNVRVAMNAFSHTENELVLGLYRGDELTPIGSAKTKMPAGATTYLIESFEIENARPLEKLTVFAGPGKSGEIFLNGDGQGNRQRAAFFPVLTVAEASVDMKKNAVTEHFPEDDGSQAFARSQNLLSPHSDPSPEGREEIACSRAFAKPDTGVFVLFGQSQAANSGARKYTPAQDVVNFNFLDSKCYRATDPLLGASNLKGSIWSRLADKLIEAKKFKQVIVVPVAVGGTFLTEWMPGGRRHRRLSLALQRLSRANANVTAFLWQQGEAESGFTDMAPEKYKAGFLELLSSVREQGFRAPVFVAFSTYCGEGTVRNSDNIRRAQMDLATENADILLGPDTDKIGSNHRYDNCHFGVTGQEIAAKMWAEKLLAQ